MLPTLWDLWWTNWNYESFCSEHLFALSLSYRQWFIPNDNHRLNMLLAVDTSSLNNEKNPAEIRTVSGQSQWWNSCFVCRRWCFLLGPDGFLLCLLCSGVSGLSQPCTLFGSPPVSYIARALASLPMSVRVPFSLSHV